MKIYRTYYVGDDKYHLSLKMFLFGEVPLLRILRMPRKEKFQLIHFNEIGGIVLGPAQVAYLSIFRTLLLLDKTQ